MRATLTGIEEDRARVEARRAQEAALKRAKERRMRRELRHRVRGGKGSRGAAR